LKTEPIKRNSEIDTLCIDYLVEEEVPTQRHPQPSITMSAVDKENAKILFEKFCKANESLLELRLALIEFGHTDEVLKAMESTKSANDSLLEIFCFLSKLGVFP
jgi:hypothetical protein